MTIEFITVDQIAQELFNVYQKAMNSTQDTYCNNFEYLTKRSQESWRAVAQYLIDKQNEQNLR